MDEKIILDEINAVNSLEGSSDPPTIDEFREYSEYSFNDVKKCFDNWTHAVKEAGLEPRRRFITKEELLEEIERLSEEHRDGKPPREKDVKKYSEFSMRPFYTKFDTWNKALEESSINSVNDSGVVQEKELIKEIEDVFEEYGVLNGEKFIEKSQYSMGCYQRRWGTFGDAVREAGFTPKRERKTTEEDIIRDVRSVYNKIDKNPTLQEYLENGNYSSDTIHRILGGYNQALQNSGLSTNLKSYNREELKSMINEFYSQESRAPTASEVKKKYDVSNIVFRRVFGTFSEAVKECGYTPYYLLSGQKHFNWDGGHKGYYGPSWLSQRKKAWERDDYSCQICGDGKEQLGRRPSVHHITSTGYWNIQEEHETMNSLNNLISLCQKHHKILEGKFEGKNYEEFQKLSKGYIENEY